LPFGLPLSLAEGVGFEPTGLSPNGFQDRHLKPLGHPSGVVHHKDYFALVLAEGSSKQALPLRYTCSAMAVARAALGLWGAGWRIRARLDALNLFQKVVIGNSLIMASGAIVGTWVTKTLVEQSNFTVATALVVLGISLSLAVNFAIMRAAFRPLNTIQSTVEEVSQGNSHARVPELDVGDAEIVTLGQTINMMLNRLEQDTRTIERHSRQIQVMSAQILHAQEEERRRIARELHDETSQALNALLLSIEMAQQSLPERDREARQRLENSKQQTAQTLDAIHMLAFDLRPTMLDDLGLVPSVRWYAKRQSETYGVQIMVEADGLDDRLPDQTEVALFRVVQEALTNVAKHASASLARVQLERYEAGVRLTVQDNGRGFDMEQTHGDRLGLFGIQERVSLLGGTLDVDSRPGRGTRLTVEVPASYPASMHSMGAPG
jgi:two-component system, NarL family, sensor histidine kinase UhpB